MDMRAMRWAVPSAVVGGVVVAGAVLGLGAGPLDPPSGAVDGQGNPVATEPSLADLEAKIDALAAGGSETDGPWEVAFLSFSSTNQDSPVAVEVASGRVLVHQVTTLGAAAVLFDGPGSTDGSARVLSGAAIGASSQSPFGATIGGGQTTSTSVVIDVIAENGLYWSYLSATTNGYVYVYYKTLEPAE